jgi:hypothetical protein
MNKQLTLLSALAASLLASFAVQAADIAELKVKGVIRPSACSPSFVGGGVVDYGTIGVKTLSATDATVLAEKTVPFSVTCDAATKVAVRAIDNRQSSIIAGLVAKTAFGSAIGDGVAFGLGTVGGKNIGVYSLRVIPTSWTADGTTPDSIYSDTASSGWAKSDNGLFGPTGAYRKAFSVAGTVIPGSYKTISGNFGVQVVIDKASNLPTTQDIPLDGSATIEVVYL